MTEEERLHLISIEQAQLSLNQIILLLDDYPYSLSVEEKLAFIRELRPVLDEAETRLSKSPMRLFHAKLENGFRLGTTDCLQF